MLDPRIRPLGTADIPRVVAINEDTRKAGYSESGFVILPLTAEQVRSETDSGSASYLVCEADGELLGFLKHSRRLLEGYQEVCWFGEPLDLTGAVQVEKVCVRVQSRCSGIGSALYRHLVATLPDEPVYTFIVVSPCPNEASIRFHRARGFRRRGRAAYQIEPGSWFLEELFVLEDRRLLDP